MSDLLVGMPLKIKVVELKLILRIWVSSGAAVGFVTVVAVAEKEGRQFWQVRALSLLKVYQAPLHGQKNQGCFPLFHPPCK